MAQGETPQDRQPLEGAPYEPGLQRLHAVPARSLPQMNPVARSSTSRTTVVGGLRLVVVSQNLEHSIPEYELLIAGSIEMTCGPVCVPKVYDAILGNVRAVVEAS